MTRSFLTTPYRYSKVHSRTVTANIARSSCSFGYDCNRRGNLHVLDNKTVMFIAGCVLELIDLSTGEHKYIRTMGGYSIGTLVVRAALLVKMNQLHSSPLSGSSE